MTLFDAAHQARDEALAQVTDNANEDWLAEAERIIRALEPGAEFTTDDLWEQLTAAGVTTHEGRALGGVLARMRLARVVVNTQQYRASKRVSTHARPIPIWRRLDA